MNRQEAAEFTRKLLARAEINAFPGKPKRINNIPVFYFEAVLSALREKQQRGKAKWVHPNFIDAHCSNCGETPEHESGSSVPLTTYCPNCGCEMEIDWGEEARHE